MFEIGRICVKIAGRDSGLKAVIVEVVDSFTVLIDGQTRRRKCNVKHLEPTKEVIKIKKGASHEEVVSEFKKLKIEIIETTPKTKKSEKPVKQKSKKEAPVKGKASAPKKEAEPKPKVKAASVKAEKPVAEKKEEVSEPVVKKD